TDRVNQAVQRSGLQIAHQESPETGLPVGFQGARRKHPLERLLDSEATLRGRSAGLRADFFLGADRTHRLCAAAAEMEINTAIGAPTQHLVNGILIAAAAPSSNRLSACRRRRTPRIKIAAFLVKQRAAIHLEPVPLEKRAQLARRIV